MFVVELLKMQHASLVEREKANVELERFEALSAKKRQANDKLASPQAELDCELATR